MENWKKRTEGKTENNEKCNVLLLLLLKYIKIESNNESSATMKRILGKELYLSRTFSLSLSLSLTFYLCNSQTIFWFHSPNKKKTKQNKSYFQWLASINCTNCVFVILAPSTKQMFLFHLMAPRWFITWRIHLPLKDSQHLKLFQNTPPPKNVLLKK